MCLDYALMCYVDEIDFLNIKENDNLLSKIVVFIRCELRDLRTITST